MKQVIKLIDRTGNELKKYEVDNWDENILAQFDGEELELYQDQDGDGEFDFQTQGLNILSALDAEQDTEIYYNNVYIGCVHYERSRSMEEYHEARRLSKAELDDLDGSTACPCGWDGKVDWKVGGQRCPNCGQSLT